MHTHTTHTRRVFLVRVASVFAHFINLATEGAIRRKAARIRKHPPPPRAQRKAVRRVRWAKSFTDWQMRYRRNRSFNFGHQTKVRLLNSWYVRLFTLHNPTCAVFHVGEMVLPLPTHTHTAPISCQKAHIFRSRPAFCLSDMRWFMVSIRLFVSDSVIWQFRVFLVDLQRFTTLCSAFLRLL